MDGKNFVPPRKVMQLFNVSYSTVKRWEREDKIRYITMQSGNKLYDVSSVINSKKDNVLKNICYCRVSTNNQIEDLERQVKFCKERYPNHEIVKDIGSALNWKRRGLVSILERVFNGEIDEVVVSHKDRLCRFGFELIQFFFEKNKVKLVVLNQEIKTEQQEFTDDIISIITVFSNRYYGKRKYSNKSKKNQIVFEQPTETNI